MGNYNGKNKERRKQNRLPIEQRSEYVCSTIMKELFSDEIVLVESILSKRVDYSKIDVSLDNGLVFIFEDGIEKHIASDLRKAFASASIYHKFHEDKLVIYK